MSFDYFSKDRVEYILSKLKTLFDKKQDLEWVGTKAQYETQRTSIPPGTIVNITDDYSGGGGSGGGGSELIIDTTERVIGTLFGKPLYARCVPSTIGIQQSETTLTKVLPTEQENIEMILNCRFLKHYTSDDSWSIRHVDVYMTGRVYVGKAYDSTGASNYIEMYYYWEYTKRSD